MAEFGFAEISVCDTYGVVFGSAGRPGQPDVTQRDVTQVQTETEGYVIPAPWVVQEAQEKVQESQEKQDTKAMIHTLEQQVGEDLNQIEDRMGKLEVHHEAKLATQHYNNEAFSSRLTTLERRHIQVQDLVLNTLAKKSEDTGSNHTKPIFEEKQDPLTTWLSPETVPPKLETGNKLSPEVEPPKLEGTYPMGPPPAPKCPPPPAPPAPQSRKRDSMSQRLGCANISCPYVEHESKVTCNTGLHPTRRPRHIETH
jgi:hypothetical protein